MSETLNSSETIMSQLLEQMTLQQAEMKALRDKLAQQESELSQQKAEIASLKAVEAPAPIVPTQAASTSSRRRMLKKMGAVAAGLAVAGAIGTTIGGESSTALAYGGSAALGNGLGDDVTPDGGPVKDHPPMKFDISIDGGPKRNATGDALILGSGSQASSTNSSTGADLTRIYNPANGSGRLANILYQVQNYSNRFPTPPSGYRFAIVAQSTGDDNASGSRCAVYGLTDSFGISIYGQSENGSAVAGESSNYYGGYFTGGLAPIRLVPSGTATAPTSLFSGTLYVSSTGALYYGAGGSSVRKLAGAETAGALHVFPSPGRFLDSRTGSDRFVLPGNTVPSPIPGFAPASLPSGSNIVSYKITGAAAKGSGPTIPTGATAILGNITVIAGAGADGGYVLTWPSGGAIPSTSTINYNSNQVIANSFVCGLSATGNISIAAYQSTNIIIDVVGYYL